MTRIKDNIISCDSCGRHVDFAVHVNWWCGKCKKDFCCKSCFEDHVLFPRSSVAKECKGSFLCCILDPQYRMNLQPVKENTAGCAQKEADMTMHFENAIKIESHMDGYDLV